MRTTRLLGVALSLGILTGCQGFTLSPNQMNAVNSLLADYGFSLKTVDPATGQTTTYTQQDVQGVTGSDGKPIPYTFDSAGRMVLKPTSTDTQTVKVVLKDGTARQFQFQGTQGSAQVNADVAFVPDSSGQAYTSKVSVGGVIDVKAQFQAQQSLIANKRVKLTFGGTGIDGLNPTTFRAAFFDRLQLPTEGSEVTADGILRADPNIFYLARQYQLANGGTLPLLRVAFAKAGKIQIVLARMDKLPELPEFKIPAPGEPAPPPPPIDQFQANQTLDLTVTLVTTADTLQAYLDLNQLQTKLPKPGEAPPAPRAEEQAAMKQAADDRAVTVTLPGITGLEKNQIKTMLVGRDYRPLDDLISVTNGNQLKLDPMLFFAMQSYRVGRMKTDDFPWIHLLCDSNGTRRVIDFRIKVTSAAQVNWLTSITWMPSAPPEGWPAYLPWAPPPPPVEFLGTGHVIAGNDIELNTINLPDKSLDNYLLDLKNAPGPNPA